MAKEINVPKLQKCTKLPEYFIYTVKFQNYEKFVIFHRTLQPHKDAIKFKLFETSSFLEL